MLTGMKDKGLIFVLLIVAVGLGVALIVVNKRAADERKDAAEKLATQSNNVVSAKKSLEELQEVNQTLETNVAAMRSDFSNKLAQSDANLRSTEAALEKAKAEAQAEAKAQAESVAALAERDKKISDLESRNAELDKQDGDLRAAMTNLQTRIELTQSKLAKSEGDRDLLLKELKSLQAAKEDLEKQFNTISTLRGQLRKLRIEEIIARRLDWMRRGVYSASGERGGERLIHPALPTSPGSGAGANVEIGRQGPARIQEIPPTNAPPK
jgi:chromosome segregation ATPase